VSLSVAAIQPPAAIFREEQRFGWWVYALLAVMMAMAWALFLHRGGGAGRAAAGFDHQAYLVGVAVGMILPAVLVVGVLRMSTVVTPGVVRVWFGFVPTVRRAFPIDAVARVEVVQYRPLRDYGFWGVRIGPDGERVFNARGDRGVRLHLLDGSRVLIGSQRPEDLALAVEGALRPGL